jgi:hypothetical protein
VVMAPQGATGPSKYKVGCRVGESPRRSEATTTRRYVTREECKVRFAKLTAAAATTANKGNKEDAENAVTAVVRQSYHMTNQTFRTRNKQFFGGHFAL